MRLIDADALKEGLKEKMYGHPFERTFLSGVVDSEPTIDAVPVVRCCQCNNHSDSDGKHYCKFWRMYCPDDSDFFCKAGERKEGAD